MQCKICNEQISELSLLLLKHLSILSEKKLEAQRTIDIYLSGIFTQTKSDRIAF